MGKKGCAFTRDVWGLKGAFIAWINNGEWGYWLRRPATVAILGGFFPVALYAGSEDPSSGNPTPAPTPPPAKLLSGLPKNIRTAIDKVQSQVDALARERNEWGTMSMSNPQYAAPELVKDGKLVPTFPVGATKTFDDYFEEAGKSEGYADFAVRIFNTLTISGALQMTPESAENYLLQKEALKSKRELYDQNIEKYKIQEQDRILDYQTQRQGILAAHNQRVADAKIEITRASAARQAAETKLRKAKTEVARAEAAADRLGDDLRNAEILATGNNASDAAKDAFAKAQVKSDHAKEELSTAKADETEAEANLDEAQTAETTAKTAYTAALGESLAMPKLAVDPSIPDAPPTLGTYSLPTTDAPGTALGLAAAAAANNPEAKRADLDDMGDDSFARRVAPDENRAFSARQRLEQAASNKLAQEIFNFLGDPSAALVFKDKSILYGVATVEATPGWRTGLDYNAQLDIKADLEWSAARVETLKRLAAIKVDEDTPMATKRAQWVAAQYLKTGSWPTAKGATTKSETEATAGLDTTEIGGLARMGVEPLNVMKTLAITPSSASPAPSPTPALPDGLDFQGLPDLKEWNASNVSKLSVVAISPMMERQSVDMTSSRASQFELAIFLSAAMARSGMKGQGEIFDKFVRSQRQDVGTRSMLPVLNAYNYGGPLFGFHFGPRVQALDKPGGRNPKPARVLGAQTFPVLLMIGFTRSDVEPVVIKSVGDALVVVEPTPRYTQTTSWSFQQKRGVFHAFLRTVFLPGYPGRPTQAPSDILNLMLANGEAIGAYLQTIVEYVEEKEQFIVDGKNEGLSRRGATLMRWVAKVQIDFEKLRSAVFGQRSPEPLPVDYLVDAPAEPPILKPPVFQAIFPRVIALKEGDMGNGVKGIFADIVIAGKNLDQLDLTDSKVLPEGVADIHTLTSNFPIQANGKQAAFFRVNFKDRVERFQIGVAFKDSSKTAKELPSYLYTPPFEVMPFTEGTPKIRAIVVDPAKITDAMMDQGSEVAEDPKIRKIQLPVRLEVTNIDEADLNEATIEVLSFSPKGDKDHKREVTGSVVGVARGEEDTFDLSLEFQVPSDIKEFTFRLLTRPSYVAFGKYRTITAGSDRVTLIRAAQ